MHLDITFGFQVVESSPYFLEKHLAIPTSPFFHFPVTGFCVIYIYIKF